MIRFWLAKLLPPGARRLASALAFGTVIACAEPAGAVEIHEVTSPGGIKAWLVEDHALPIIAMAAAFNGGSAQDPAGKEGVSALLSAMLDQGAGDLTDEAFQAILERRSITLTFDTNNDEFLIALRILSSRRDEAFGLLRLALAEPRFDLPALERRRALVLSVLNAQRTDPGTIAQNALAAAAFPNHPYGRPVLGTTDVVATLTADDLRAYRSRVFARDGLTISVVGDIDAPTLAKLLDESFGNLPEHGILVPVPDVEPVEGARVNVPINLPQALVVFASRGINRYDPDFIGYMVADRVFGGVGSSRLFNEVRSRRGLAYSPFSVALQLSHAGLEIANAATDAPRAAETIDAVQAEIARYITEGPTDQEVEAAKRYLIGSYALRFTSSTGIAQTLLNYQLARLGIDYINQRNRRIEAITVDEVKAAAKRLFGPNPTIVTVGLPR